MATMAKIREMSPWALGGIAVLFIGFMVMSDANPSSWQASQDPRTMEVGSVNGESIYLYDFNLMVENAASNMQQQAIQQGREPNVEYPRLRQQIWDQLVRSKLLEQTAEELGVSVTDKEVADLLFYQPPQVLRQMFSDTNGVFDQNMYQTVMRNPRSLMTGERNMPAAQYEQLENFLLQVEDQYREQLLEDKVRTAVSAMNTGAPDSYLQYQYAANQGSADVEYLVLRAASIPDSEVQVTDDEIKAYIDANPGQFQQKASRKLKYVSLPDTPSDSDSATAKKKEKRLQEAIANAVTMNDKAAAFDRYLREYYGTNSEYTNVENVDAQRKPYLMSLQVNEVIGPVFLPDGSYFFKLSDRREAEKPLASASHILLKFTEDNKDSVRKNAESLMDRIRNGEDFAALATEYSEDPSVKTNRGDMGYFERERMVPEFSDAVFGAETGDLVGPVESQFGFHIIKVQGFAKEELRWSEIQIKPLVSRRTLTNTNRRARLFRQRIVEEGLTFDSVAAQMGLSPRETGLIFPNQPALGSHALASFAQNGEMGDVCEPIEVDGYGRIVAEIVEIRKDGVKPFEEAKQTAQARVMTNKKLDIAMQRLESISSAVKAAPSLTAYVVTDSLIQTGALTVKNNGSVPGLGQDFMFTAVAFDAELNQLVGPRRGERMAFFLRVRSRNIPGPDQFAAKRDSLYSAFNETQARQAYFAWFTHARDNADIVDNRAQHFPNE